MAKNNIEPQKKSVLPYQILIGALVILIYFAVVVYNRRASDPETVANQNNNVATIPEESGTGSATGRYKSGTFTAVGNYVSPGGKEEFSVTLTLAGGIVRDTSVIVESATPTSVQFQQEFADNYEQFVVGKNIDELKLNKVAGSSLTPIGFNDAVEKIKAQAAL